MGADSLGLSDTELKQIVTDWRYASPHITELWWSVDRAVKKAVKEKTVTETHGLTFSYEAGFLFIELPSGRHLAYAKPRIGENKFGGECPGRYHRISQRQTGFGGLLVQTRQNQNCRKAW